jgi:hypothetical protein
MRPHLFLLAAISIKSPKLQAIAETDELLEK